MALFWVAAAFVAGLVAGDWLAARGLFGCGWPVWAWPIPLALMALTPLLSRFDPSPATALVWPQAAGFEAPRARPSLALVAACSLALLLGIARVAASPLFPCWTPHDLAYHNEPAARSFDSEAPHYTVYGYISRYVPAAGDRQRSFVRVQLLDGRPVDGALTLIADTRELTYGLPVRVRGILSAPPDFAGFSYRTYLARQGIHSQMTLARVQPQPGALKGNPILRHLYSVRTMGERLIQRSLPEPYAALAAGILLGIDTSIPEEVQQQFSDTSATHVLVISGSNIALVTGVLLALSGWVAGRRAGFVLALAGILLYTLLVGGEPSVLRAALMGGLVVLAARLGRASTALVSLGFAALVLGLANPHIVWDVGFQLSALATAGLILLAPRLARGAESALRVRRSTQGGRAAGFVIESLAVTLAASLAVLPLLLYTFQRLSLIGLLTNLLIVPVQPLILFAGSGALAAGLVGMQSVAQLLFWAAWLGLAWTLAVVQSSASVRWASLAVGGFGLGGLLASYALLGALLWQARRRPTWLVRPKLNGWTRWLRSPAATGLLAVGAALIWLGVRTLPDRHLHVYLFPAERTIAALIQTPSGRQVLIDGGDDPTALLTELGTVMPYWDRSLDMVVLSEPDARTAATQRALPARLQIDQALRGAGEDETYSEWQRGLAAAGIPVATIQAGGWIEVGDGAALWVLAPQAGREDPLALRLVYGDFSLIVGGGGQPADAPGQRSTVLVLADGADAGSAAADLAVTYGESAAAGSGATFYPETAGRIHLWTDGARWWSDPVLPVDR